MSGVKITDLTATSSVADSDIVVVVDVSTDTTKKVTKANLLSGVGGTPLANIADSGDGVVVSGPLKVGDLTISDDATDAVLSFDSANDATFTGDVTAAVFYGDGSQLTGVSTVSYVESAGDIRDAFFSDSESLIFGPARSWHNDDNDPTGTGGYYARGYRNTNIGEYAGGAWSAANALNLGDYNLNLGKYAGFGNANSQGATNVGYRAGYYSGASKQANLGHGAGMSWTNGGSTDNYSVNVGYYAGQTSTGQYGIFVGYKAGYYQSGERATFAGYKAGYDNTGDTSVGIGTYSLKGNTGFRSTAVGDYTGVDNTATGIVAVGPHALYSNTGAYSVGVGGFAGQNNTGAYLSAVGYEAGNSQSGKNVVAVGYRAAKNNTKNYYIEMKSTDSDGRMWFSKDSDWNFGAAVTAPAFIGDGSQLTGISGGSGGLDSAAVQTMIDADLLGTGTQSTAVGVGASATASYSTAIGFGAQATAPTAAIAINDATASGMGSMAIHDNSVASGTYAIAIGQSAKATSTNTIAFGYGAEATAGNAIAIGKGADAKNSYAVAVGDNAVANGSQGAIALGRSSSANGYQGIALGYEARANQDYSISIGKGAGAQGGTKSGILIGYQTGLYMSNSPSEEGNVFIGRGAGSHSSLMQAANYFNRTVAIGEAAATQATGEIADAIAIGYRAGQVNMGSNSINIGRDAGKTNAGDNSITINATGLEVSRTDQYAIEVRTNDSDGRMWFSKDSDWNFGAAVTAPAFKFTDGTSMTTAPTGGGSGGLDSAGVQLLIDDDLIGSGLNSVAVGINAAATASYAVSIGDNATVSHPAVIGIAIGRNTSVTTPGGVGGVAIGSGASVTDNDTLAIGRNTIASAADATAIGPNTVASGMRSIAIGNNVSATTDDAVTIGSSVAGRVTYSTDSDWVFGASVNVNGGVNASGDITAFSTAVSSDPRLKENVETLDDAVSKVQQLHGVSWDWVRGGKSAGVISTDVQAVMPEAVIPRKLFGEDTEYDTVNYNALIGLLVEAVKDLQSQIDELKAGE